MSITENIDRIEQGKTSIISTIKSKGVNVPSGVLINEIAPYINEIQGGSVPTDTDTYNRLNFTNISGIDGTLTIEDKVDISNMEYSIDSYTFSKVEERLFNFPNNSTIYLKWEGDCNLDKDSQSCFFSTNIDTMVSGILRNGDIDREYNGLFNGVVSIKDVSNLIFRSEYLGEQSIASAFRGTGITTTPTIEATKFGVACFDACYMNSSLQKATKFKVEECERDSFLFMYRECYYLHNVEIETNQWNEECFREWLFGCASEGYLYSNFENIPTNTVSGLPIGWKRKVGIVIIEEDELVEHNKDTSDWDYLVFNSQSSFNDDIKINNADTYVDRFEYSTDGGKTFYYTNRNLAPLYANGETIIRWEGKLNQPYLHDSFNYERVFHVESAIYRISGELKHGNETYNYACMFKNEWWLRSAENLRLTSDVVGISAYELLFYGCGNLQLPPQITATTVYSRGCCEIFHECQSLQYAPELTATNISDYAYFQLFRNCSLINYVKIAITDWNPIATEMWLDNVAPTGTLETNATNIPTGSSGIPEGWTVKPIEIPIPEIAYDEHIVAIQNIDNVEGTVLMRQPFTNINPYINCKISTNGNTFNNYTFGTEINIQPKDIVYFKFNKGVAHSSSSGENSAIHSTVKYKVAGILKPSTNYAFNSFFLNETNLVDASELQLSNTNVGSYKSMFSGCTSLVQAPALPATELASDCYENMFENCISLTTAPALPATTLYNYCYSSMFYGCSSLTTAPILPSKELKNDCYYSMFRDCTALNYVKHNITEWDSENTQYWLSGVASSGTVECPADSTIPSNSISGIPEGWVRVDISDEPSLPEVADNEDILAIENVDEVEGTVYMTNPNNISIQYSTNGSEFNEYTTESEVPIGVGEKVYFKWSEAISKYSIFISKSIVNSSVKYKTYGELKKGNNEYAYYSMFHNQTRLVDASQLKLTATTLNKGCCGQMFYNCNSLKSAPAILPANTLSESCYSSMFYGCSSLVQPPALPAKTLQISCYSNMFYNCSSLTTAPELPATEFPISDVLKGSYRYMFRNCTSLNYVKHHIVNWDTTSASDWLYNVAPSGIVKCPANSTMPYDNTSGIPNGWTKVSI